MKLIRTFLAGEGEGVCSGVGEGGPDCSGEIDGEGDSPGVAEGVGVGDSCAAAIATRMTTQEREMTIWKRRLAMRDLSIVAPVHVRKNVVPPFAVVQKLFIEIICHKLIVKQVEASKVIDWALTRVC